MSNDRSVVGDLINFRGLVYAPMNENGVVFLFGKVAGDLNMYIEEVKPGFPDCIARRYNGKGWERVRVEFEYKSSAFKAHKHDPEGCDVIVCWEHDWAGCELEVVELRDRIKEMENEPIEPPDRGGSDGVEGDIEKWFDSFNTSETARKIFHAMAGYFKSINEACFYKVRRSMVTFYSPKRVFAEVSPRKNIIRLHMFTNGQALGKVKQFDYETTGKKWGALSLSSFEEFEEAKPWLAESLKRINEAVKKNEPTSWNAAVEDIAEDE